MNDYNEQKEKKGGFWSSLAGLLRGGSSAASSGFGSAGGAAGGLGGLFATKAGIVGMVLGGATIAAGVGVVYNFIGPSSKPAYSPELFQNSYYEEEANKAGMERAKARDASGAASSTLDMFKEQARKDGIGLDGESASGQPPEASAEQPGNGPSADAAAPEAPAAEQGAGAPKLQAASGFGSKGGGGGGGSSIPRMQGGGGGLSGGIGGQFASVYRPPAQAVGGKMSGMTASAARVKNSPKYAVPNFNKKGAFGQAKFAKNMGNMSRSMNDTGMKSTTGIPFDSSQQTGTGDVGTPETGSGLGGAGVSNGAKLKGNDPSLNNSEVTPPKVPEPENVSPWKAWTDRAMYAMLAAAVLILITKILANFAKGLPWVYKLAMITAYAAMAAAALVMLSGMMLMSKYGQKWAGAMYLVAGAMLMYQAYEALKGVGQAATANHDNLGSWGKGCAGYDQNAAAAGAPASQFSGGGQWEGSGYERVGSGDNAMTLNSSTNEAFNPKGESMGTLNKDTGIINNADGKPTYQMSSEGGKYTGYQDYKAPEPPKVDAAPKLDAAPKVDATPKADLSGVDPNRLNDIQDGNPFKKTSVDLGGGENTTDLP